MAMEDGNDRPLSAIAKAFKELEGELNQGEGAVLKVAPFAHACSLISILFGCLGIAFKFAEKDYVGKVRNSGVHTRIICFCAASITHEHSCVCNQAIATMCVHLKSVQLEFGNIVV